MTVNKFTLLKVVLIFAVVAILGFSLFSLFKQSSTEPNVNDQTLSITTPQGRVEVRNIYKNPLEKIQDNLELVKNSKFSIVYFGKDQAFLITLLVEPLSQTRIEAENELIKNLEITKDQACQLKVTMTVPYDVNAGKSGQDWGLSFCPAAKSF